MNYNHDDVFGGYFNQSHERNLNNMSFDDSKNFIQVYQNDKAYGGPHQEAHGHNLEATLSANSQPQYLNEDSKKLKVLELADHYSIDHDKLMRKIDLCVIPPFALLYFISFLNKSSYGLVYVDGIMDDLHISKMQLASAYAAFFVPIICFQFFSNIALRIIKPHFWIAFGVLFYGVFNLASGFCKNYSTFVVCQFFHGLFQAGSESAVVYIMSHYYERLEAQRRFSGLYSVNCLGGMTANLISLGINLHFANNNGFAA